MTHRATQGCGEAGSLHPFPDMHWGPRKGISIGHVSVGRAAPQEDTGCGMKAWASEREGQPGVPRPQPAIHVTCGLWYCQKKN